MSRSRDGILGRVRAAVAGRSRKDHPGEFGAWRPAPGSSDVIGAFGDKLRQVGGEVARAESTTAARSWIEEFVAGFDGVSWGLGVPAEFRPARAPAAAVEAALGVSMARGAVAETGSVVLDSCDGRYAQLLPPTHLVLVRSWDVHATLQEALAAAGDLPSALALHSGPSRSADIGQILVKGVHGPGRLVVLVIDAMP